MAREEKTTIGIDDELKMLDLPSGNGRKMDNETRWKLE